LLRLLTAAYGTKLPIPNAGVLVKSGKELFTFDNMAGKNIGVIAGTTNARAVRDQLARRNLSATLVEFRDRREGIAALARGDLDGFASDKFVLLALARAESLRDFTLLPDDLAFEPFAIMLPRGDWAFRLAVNTALAKDSLGWRQRQLGIGFCQRVGRPTAGCDPCAMNPGHCCAQTGDADNPDCICHGSSQTAR
jgi:hypothetical protein